MKMKRLIFLIALSTIFLSGISAQQKQKRFTRERFQAELEQYITKKACLTQEIELSINCPDDTFGYEKPKTCEDACCGKRNDE